MERGRPVRNRGQRPPQRPFAAPGRARRPRSQRGHVKHTLRVVPVCSANEAHPWVGSVFWTAAASEGRRSRARRRFGADKLRFDNIAQGAVEESRYSLILAKDLDYGDVSELSLLLEEVSKLLAAYSQAILDSDS